MQVIASVAFAALSAALTAPAFAGVIDFEDLANDSWFEYSSVISRGFLVTHDGSGDGFASVLGPGKPGNADYSGNGTRRLLALNTSNITISAIGDASFDLLRFDGGETWLATPHLWARQILVVGQLAAGGSISQTFRLDLHKDAMAGMQQFILGDGFRDLLSVTFSGLGNSDGTGPEFSLDNLALEQAAVAIDSPPSPWLLGAGLAALTAVRRRRFNSAVGAR